MSSFFDTCLDLNRAVIDGVGGTHRIVHVSQKNNNNNEEEIITANNINEVSSFFKYSDSSSQCNRPILVLLIHPIQRAAIAFQKYKEQKSDPNYDNRIENVSLLNFAQYLLSSKDKNSFPMLRSKMSNYLTQALLHILSSTGSVIDDNNKMEYIIQFVKSHCIQIGLVENLQETYHGFAKIILQAQNKNVNDYLNIIGCIDSHVIEQKQEIKQSLIKEEQLLVAPGSKEWALLEKLNLEDSYLYQKMKEIFVPQQGRQD